MSYTTSIYTQQTATIPLPEIMSAMQQRGIPLDWQFVLSSERDQPENWTMGYFFPAEETEPQIDIFVELVTPDLREDVINAYDADLTNVQRSYLSTAQKKYQLSISQRSEPEEQRLYFNLVDVLADLGQGLIHSIESHQFYDRHEYVALHSDILGQ